MKELVGEKKLMYDLIFGDDSEYEIPILEYIDEKKDVDIFTTRVINNLMTSGVIVSDDVLILTKDKSVWILKIDRKI